MQNEKGGGEIISLSHPSSLSPSPLSLTHIHTSIYECIMANASMYTHMYPYISPRQHRNVDKSLARKKDEFKNGFTRIEPVRLSQEETMLSLNNTVFLLIRV